MTSSKPIGHYTQVVLANTYKIGCGMARFITSGRFANNQFYVCNYGPGGNFLNQPVYQIGSPATACPSGTVAEDGLCVEDIKADIEIGTL